MYSAIQQPTDATLANGYGEVANITGKVPAITPLDIVRQLYSKLGQGEPDGLLELFAPEITWTEALRFP